MKEAKDLPSKRKCTQARLSAVRACNNNQVKPKLHLSNLHNTLPPFLKKVKEEYDTCIKTQPVADCKKKAAEKLKTFLKPPTKKHLMAATQDNQHDWYIREVDRPALGEKPKGNKPNGDKPKGEKSKPKGDKPKGEKSKPKGDKPKGEKSKPKGDKGDKEDKPKGDKPKGDKPKGEKSKPKGEKSKPKGDKGDKEDKPKSDKPKSDKWEPKGDKEDKPKSDKWEPKGDKEEKPKSDKVEKKSSEDKAATPAIDPKLVACGKSKLDECLAKHSEEECKTQDKADKIMIECLEAYNKEAKLHLQNYYCKMRMLKELKAECVREKKSVK